MTEDKIKENSSKVNTIYIEKEGWYRVEAYTNSEFVTIYEGMDGYEEPYTLSFEELADRDDVRFYTLKLIEE